ncbi:MAG: helicase-related protein, partial [Pseudomonadota bacterium]
AIDPSLLALDNEAGQQRLRRWLLGILYRQRERGGLYHPYLDSFARQGYWGKFPFGRAVTGREFYPPAGRFRPRLLSTGPHRDHDTLLATSRPGQLAPWQILWARRSLGLPNTPESSLLDLLRAWLDAGCESGLLKTVHTDGNQRLLALSPEPARLWPEGRQFECSYSGGRIFRPHHEVEAWDGGPTLAYRGDHGIYRPVSATDRQSYYRKRYRKGALRRVFAREHTGLLTTLEREALEYQFNHGGHADDPNVLTATSTLEMGIDIGDLSSTLLCSIPPTTASYLQRIGRAGRSTGTALVLAVINQRPHDLFFFGRPQEMLAGHIEPPGCWLDASAVLVRQYLAFCFDSAVKESLVNALPHTGKQLVEDLDGGKGPISTILAWIARKESTLQAQFMTRFSDDVRDDTRERFMQETGAQVLRERIHAAARDFDSQRQAITNAQKRLQDQKKEASTQDDQEALKEIEQESRILRVRQQTLNRTAALEILIEYGLLPNYAFPERGVHFNGILYNEHRRRPTGEKANEGDLPAYDIVRGAGSALKELAPRNRFYTHSREFEIQQLSLGTHAQPLLTPWAICGECGHMRRVDALNQPDASPACPQCGYA